MKVYILFASLILCACNSRPSVDAKQAAVDSAVSAVNAANVARQAAVDSAVAAVKEGGKVRERVARYRDNWGSYVVVKPRYVKRAFGGVKNVMLTVENKLPYPINNVVLLANYVSIDKVVGNETRDIGTIPAKSSMDYAMPDGSGTSVQGGVCRISCNDIQLKVDLTKGLLGQTVMYSEAGMLRVAGAIHSSTMDSAVTIPR